jgi:hypothetical protein
MPRRNHNARPQHLPDPLPLAVVINEFREWARDLRNAQTVRNGQWPCTGCRRPGYWDGDYCPLCRASIIRDARRAVTRTR